MTTPPQYRSDRWITPGVLVTGILTAGVVVLGTIAAVAWLTERGLDPDPMLKLVGIAVTAAGSLGSFVLQLVNRRSVTKTERNTGLLASAVYDVADAMPRPVVPRHAYPETVEASAAPGLRGS